MICNKRCTIWTIMVFNSLLLGVAAIFVTTATIDIVEKNTNYLWISILINILGVALLISYFLGFFGALEKIVKLLNAYIIVVTNVAFIECSFGIFLLYYKPPIKYTIIGSGQNMGILMIILSVLQGIAAVFFLYFKKNYASNKIGYLEPNLDSQNLFTEEQENEN